MSLFVYVTDECRKDIQKYSLGADVDRFTQRLLQAQQTNLFDPFPPPYLKKRFLRQIRLIASQQRFGEHLVVIFLRLLVRGDDEYKDGFLKDPKTYGAKHLASLYDIERIEDWLEEQIKVAPSPDKPEPTDDERRYLWDVLGRQVMSGSEVFVCESEDWVKSISDKRLRRKLVLLADPILVASEKGTEQEDCVISIPNRNDLRVIGRYFPEHAKLFLAALLLDPSEESERAVRKRYEPLLAAPYTEVTDQLILQYSMRAYPHELLLDENLWIDVELDEASNLALSPEETAILESVHNFSNSDTSVGFPLFINGRAGSGKSTILQYLFADYLRLYLELQPISSLKYPIYFAYSNDLLQRSWRVVSSLLNCGYEYLMRHEGGSQFIDPDKQKDVLEKCFRDFHTFLYSQLAPEAKSGGFSRSAYVDYTRFRLLWQEKFGRDPKAIKSYGADICWHVIRSYIKGLSVDGYLDPEEYDEQPDGERTVSTETFKVIYDRVWENWYKPLCEDGRCWDDQDLARKLLDDDIIRAEYPAIFCDEAQDFTRLELEVLFRLSLFSERRLTAHELNRVPFAFAGDPFQTLNPTGFRWDAIKSAFVLKFVSSLNPTAMSGITDLNYQELSFNYRSTKNVVRLCNGIQALRSVLFDIPNLKPQTNWHYEHSSPMPVWFPIGTNETLDALKQEADLTIILPCQEGEEIKFVEQDEFLSSAVQRDDTGVPRNVLSATRAKGLEFKRVALYGFGENSFPDLLKPIFDEKNSADPPEKALPREYFVNKLYVAASRPKRQLVVIDTANGMNALWRFATDTDVQEAVISKLRHERDLWRDNIGMLQAGEAQSWSSDRDDLTDIAVRYEHEGQVSKDPYLLRQASLLYQNTNDRFKAKQCLAFALLYEQKYGRAGDTFVECNDIESALSAYWEGSEHKSIIGLGENPTAAHILSRIEYRVCEFLTTKNVSAESGLNLLKLIEDRMAGETYLDRALSSQAWSGAIESILDQLLRTKRIEGSGSTWQEIAESAERLLNKGFRLSRSIIGMLFYRAEQWKRAISYWSTYKDTQTEQYREASARAIISEIEDGHRSSLSREEAQEVAGFYQQNKQYAEAVKYWTQVGDERSMATICGIALTARDYDAALEAVKSATEIFVRQGRWPQFIALLSERRWNLLSKDKRAALRTLMDAHHNELVARATLALAQSELLPAAEASSLRAISDILKISFIENASGWAPNITPEVAGAAIERAGRDIDALKFYENVIASLAFSAEQKQRAQKRWVKVKQRQAAREQRRRKDAGLRHAAEAEERIKAWGIADPESIPEFPVIKGFTKPINRKGIPATLPSSEASREQQTVWQMGDLAFRYSRPAQRVNIEHQATLETAIVRIAERKCISDDMHVIEVSGNEPVFLYAHWMLRCDLTKVESGVIEFYLEPEKKKYTLAV